MQLAFFATQPIGVDAAAVWLFEILLPVCAPLRSSNAVHFRRLRHATGRERFRGEPDFALSCGYAPDSARAKGSSIVGEPGES